MNDTISDALTRIKNGYLASKGEVILYYSKLTKAVCEVLKKEGYIGDYKEIKKEGSDTISQIVVSLRYKTEGGLVHVRKPALSEVRRISKPGLRIYKSKRLLPYVLNGLGVAIISTPKGVMTDKEARKMGVGGEIIAYVW